MVKRNSESNGPIGTTQKTADEKLMQRPRPYQIELFEEAMKRNIIAYLDTGSGKTLVSVLLIQQYAEPLLEVSRPEIIRLVNEARKKSRISKSSDTSNLPQKFDHDEMDDIAEATNMDYAEGTDDINEGGTEINSNRLSQQLMWRQEQIDTLMLPKQPRKVVFLVPTVPLVAQQAEKIRSNTDLSIGEYSRDDSASVTYWDAIGWYHEMSMRQVLVFTPQIFLNVLRHGFMSLSRDVSLIVVDECHHTAKNHAYNVIFREFYHSIQAGDSRPKVFGMTASPIHQKTTTHGASLEKLLELQNNLGCTVMTIANRNSLRGYVPQATEMLVEYESSPVGSDFDESTATPSERFYNYHITELTILLDQFTRLRLSDRAQKVKRTITLAKQLKQDLGYWCAGRAAESFLYGFRPRSNYISRKRNFDSLETGKDANGISNPQKKRAVGEDREVVPVEETNEQLIDSKVEPRKEATSSLHAKEAPNDEKFINSAQNLPKLPDASEITPHDISPKVHAVLRLLAERAVAAVKSDRGPKSFRAMVFVEKRSTAKALCELITLVVPARFPIITCGYVTGHGSTTHRFSNDKESGMNMNSATQKRIFERFRQGDMNTVVVTRVAEEGVDISNTGYVQSRGRARDIDGSEYIVMVMRNDMHALQYLAKAKMAELLTRSIAKEVSREGLVAGEGSESSSGVGTNQVVRDEDDDELAELLVGSQDEPITTLAGAKVTSASAMQLLQHFCFARLRGRKVEDASPRFRVILEPNLSAAALWKLYRVAWRNQDNRLRQMSELRAKDLGIELPNIALRSDDTGESESNEFNGQIPFGFAFEVLLPNEVILVNSRMPSEWLCEPGSGQNHPRFIGSVRITKKLAMQSAALEACRQLYLLGALNERLLPTLHVRNDASLVNALGGSRVRGAFSLRSVLSQSLNDAGRRKDKKELQLLQKFANEDLFIRSGAVLEAVKNGAALGTISVDTLDDAVLGEYRRELPKAFTYDEKWMKIVYDQETKGAGIVQSFIPALEYGSEEEKDGADTAGSQGYANVSKSSVQNFIPPAFEFFVTIITFGPQLELYTRSCDPPVSATHNLVYGPKFPYVDSPYTNHYYYYPNPNCYALSPKEPRRSIALMTLRPIPTRSIPEFCVWLGGESPCKVKLLPWSPDEREGSRRSEASADNLDDTEQESLNDVEAENSMGYKSVMFSSKELAKIKPFQQRFWDLVLRRPLKGQNLSAKVPNETGNNDTTRETRNHESTPEAEPDPRMYMVLPVFGNPLPPDTRSRRLSYSDSVPHLPTLKLGDDSSGTYLPKLSELPDPPACNWELDWPLVDRVISEKTCTLYEWIRQIGEIAGDLVERQTNRQKGKAKDSFIEREAFDPSEEQMMKVDDGLEDLDFDLEIEQEEDENLNEPTTQISEVPPEVGFGDDDDEDYLDQIMFDETGIQEESTIAMEDELSSDAENPEPSYSTKNDKRKRRKVDIGGIERKPFCSAEESSVRSTQSPTTTYKIPSFDMLYERVLNSSGIKAEPARFSKAVFQKVNEVLAQTVVQTPHNNIKYFVRQITPDITSNNEFNAPRFAKSSAAGTGNAQTTYKSYVERLGYTVEHPDSPMVEAHHATHPRNMLRPWKYSNRQDLSDEPPDNRSNSGSNVLLVPDVCRVIPFPSEFFRLALGVFPSVLHKVEQFMLVDEFRRKIRLPMVTNRTLYSAFCAPSAHEPGNCNYERLETLGDAFLKYACSADLFQRNDDLSEGGLSVRRAKCVSNRNLYRKAKKLSLGGLLIVSPFHPRSWAPPGCLPPLVASGLAGYNRKGAVSELEDEENGWGNGSKDLFGPFSWHRSKKGAWWRLVSLKMMADFVEALVGAYYVDGGNELALHLLHRFGLITDVMLTKKSLSDRKFIEDSDRQDSRHAPREIAQLTHVGAKEAGDTWSESEEDEMMEVMHRSERVRFDLSSLSIQYPGVAHFPFDEIEARIKYRFKNRLILLEAFTHPLYSGTGMRSNLNTSLVDPPPPLRSYERLEFLGDAILDWVLTRYFFNSYPHLAPAQLTELRQAAVNNESFARLAVQLHFHKFVLHNSPTIERDISAYLAHLSQLLQRETGSQGGINNLNEEMEIDSARDMPAPSQSAHDGPKVLGDLFEAVAGAVLVDSGWKVPIFWGVFKPLMIDFLEVHVNPDVVNKSPVRQMHEYFQKLGFAVNDVSYDFNDRSSSAVNTSGLHECQVFLLDEVIASGMGNIKTAAKRQATLSCLAWIPQNAEKIQALLAKSLASRQLADDKVGERKHLPSSRDDTTITIPRDETRITIPISKPSARDNSASGSSSETIPGSSKEGAAKQVQPPQSDSVELTTSISPSAVGSGATTTLNIAPSTEGPALLDVRPIASNNGSAIAPARQTSSVTSSSTFDRSHVGPSHPLTSSTTGQLHRPVPRPAELELRNGASVGVNWSPHGLPWNFGVTQQDQSNLFRLSDAAHDHQQMIYAAAAAAAAQAFQNFASGGIFGVRPPNWQFGSESLGQSGNGFPNTFGQSFQISSNLNIGDQLPDFSDVVDAGIDSAEGNRPPFALMGSRGTRGGTRGQRPRFNRNMRGRSGYHRGGRGSGWGTNGF